MSSLFGSFDGKKIEFRKTTDQRAYMNRTLYLTLLLGITVWLGGCTQVVTAPISVAGSVVEAGFGMVGAAGGAVVDTVTGGDEEEEKEEE